jgi:ribA/ribD-fused uncharacterized protein
MWRWLEREGERGQMKRITKTKKRMRKRTMMRTFPLTRRRFLPFMATHCPLCESTSLLLNGCCPLCDAEAAVVSTPQPLGGAAGAARARPTPGPGQEMTPTRLLQRWRATAPSNVLGFYSHKVEAELACFSNFYDQSAEPFNFEVPAELRTIELPAELRVVPCDFSEKAIMMCKAAVMGDQGAYTMICAAATPNAAKQFGRKVRNFDADIWDSVLCSVAFHVIFRKFSQSEKLRGVLLGTGDLLIAEATVNDKIWGIGIDREDTRVHEPMRWAGSNILGWALMEARTALR